MCNSHENTENKKVKKDISCGQILGRIAEACGREWELAPKGKRHIDKISRELYQVQNQIKSYADLLQVADSALIGDINLYGLGVSLGKISIRLEKLEEKIQKIIIEKKDSDSLDESDEEDA